MCPLFFFVSLPTPKWAEFIILGHLALWTVCVCVCLAQKADVMSVQEFASGLGIKAQSDWQLMEACRRCVRVCVCVR